MKKQLIYTLAAIAAVMASCKDSKNFLIEGTVKNPKDIKKVFLYQADSARINLIDSTVLNDKDEFIFKRVSAEPSMYKVQVGDASFDFIAKNGEEIEFETDWADTTRNYTVKGSEESEKLKSLNQINKKYNGQTNALIALYQADMQKHPAKGDSLNEAYVPRMNVILKNYGDEVIGFMNENKNSLAGFYAAYSLDPNQYEQELIGYAESVKGKFAGNPTVESFIRRMEFLKPVSVGAKAPNFTLPDVSGKAVKLSDFKGKYVLLDFWASWCGPCRQENPNVVKAYNLFKDKGFTILGISLDESEGDWKQAIKADGLTWAHVSELKRFNGPVVAQYRIEAIPANFLLDKSGTIIAKNLRGAQLEQILAEKVK